jgi:hypothetical protein
VFLIISSTDSTKSKDLVLEWPHWL